VLVATANGRIIGLMKVAIVIESIEPRRGGAETSTMQLVQHLARQGCEVHVLTGSRVPSSPTMTVHPVGRERRSLGVQTTAFMREAALAMRRGGFDIIHSMLPIPGCDVYQPRGGTVAESIERNLAIVRSPVMRRVRQLATRFNAKRQAQLRQESELFALYPDSVVAAVSQYVVDQLQRHYGLDEDRVRLVFNGVDVAEVSDETRAANRRTLREELGIGPDEFVLLMVAHNFRLKGVGPCIEAVAELTRRGGPAARVLIVGRGDAMPFRRRAERLRIAEQFLFVGPSERVGVYYDASDVLVHPTYYDPCSRVVLEALATGLPAITTRHNGAAEAIEEGACGYVIDSADAVDQLADRIMRLADAGVRRQFGRYGRQLRERVSMARHAEELLLLYDEILSKRAPR
jgi:UDP-glucose:(heptosyl)LPS alpha-1,3-glucosyltransferase